MWFDIEKRIAFSSYLYNSRREERISLMSFFKRKKNQKQEDINTIPEAIYGNFKEELVKSLSTGSKDAKLLDIFTEDDQIYLYTDSGNLKYAYSKNEPLEISERLFWVLDEQLSLEDREKLVAFNYNFENLEAYLKIIDEMPQAQSVIEKILSDYTLSIALKVRQSKIVKINTELLFSIESRLVKKPTFLTIGINELDDKLAKMEQDEKKALKNINEEKNESVKLSLGKEFIPKNDIEKLLVLAADSNKTISDVRAVSRGFLFSEVIQTLSTLMFEKKIVVDELDEEEALPAVLPNGDLAEENKVDEVTEETTVESSESAASKQMISEGAPVDVDLNDTTKNDSTVPVRVDLLAEEDMDDDEDDWRYIEVDSESEEVATFMRDADDDGGFDLEQVEEDFVIGNTVALDDADFISDFEKALLVAGVNEGINDRIMVLLHANKKLEDKVKAIEESIIPHSQAYGSSLNDFQEKIIDKGVESILSDDGDVENLNETLNTSNETFFQLEKLEMERYELNEERRTLLSELQIHTIELNGDNVQDLINRITLKERGIDKVANIAFHDPKDDETETVDELLIGDELLVYKKKEVPVFFSLIKELGFDPFSHTQ